MSLVAFLHSKDICLLDINCSSVKRGFWNSQPTFPSFVGTVGDVTQCESASSIKSRRLWAVWENERFLLPRWCCRWKNIHCLLVQVITCAIFIVGKFMTFSMHGGRKGHLTRPWVLILWEAGHLKVNVFAAQRAFVNRPTIELLEREGGKEEMGEADNDSYLWRYKIRPQVVEMLAVLVNCRRAMRILWYQTVPRRLTWVSLMTH